MRQDSADHGCGQKCSADGFATTDPKKGGGTNFDCTGNIAEPLADADGIEGCDHHFGPGEFCSAHSDEGQREKNFDSECNVRQGMPFQSGCQWQCGDGRVSRFQSCLGFDRHFVCGNEQDISDADEAQDVAQIAGGEIPV